MMILFSLFNLQEKQKEENEESLTTSVNAGTSAVISSTSSNSHHQEDIEDVFECPELPPPMKPLLDASQFGENNCAQVTSPSKTKSLKETDFTEIEQIVKEKMVIMQASLARTKQRGDPGQGRDFHALNI